MPEKYRIVLLGPLGAGKSALTVKYLTQKFITDYDPFIDGKYSKAELVNNNQEKIVKVWDTYSDTVSSSEMDKYIKWADGFLVVYSITSRHSFEEAKLYLKNLMEQHRARNLDMKPTLILGNKVDLDRYRQVSKFEGSTLAIKYESSFMECTSASDFSIVEKVFHTLVTEIKAERVMLQPLQSMYIAESASLPKSLTRRTKSPKSPSPKLLKKSSSTFRLFNKGFKLFN